MDILDEVTYEYVMAKRVKIVKILSYMLVAVILISVPLSIIYRQRVNNQSKVDSIYTQKLMKSVLNIGEDIDHNIKLCNEIISSKSVSKVQELTKIHLASLYIKNREVTKAVTTLREIISNKNLYKKDTVEYAAFILCNLAIDYKDLFKVDEVEKYFEIAQRKRSIVGSSTPVVYAYWLYTVGNIDKAIDVLKSQDNKMQSKNSVMSQTLLSSMLLRKSGHIK